MFELSYNRIIKMYTVLGENNHLFFPLNFFFCGSLSNPAGITAIINTKIRVSRMYIATAVEISAKNKKNNLEKCAI